MSTSARTLPQIRAEGFAALLERLGPADALRFLQQYDPGRGNYTEERSEWLKDVALEELMQGIERRRGQSSR